ncbi:MAG: hypothetical protein ABI200_07655, partial [Gaiellales bacterium]
MSIRITSLIPMLATIVAVLCITPAVAVAASAETVIKDARDGSIDGNYTAAELRAADSKIDAQEREYNDWDYLFQNALRRLANPKIPKAEVVTVRDFDGDGKITAKDEKIADARTKKLKKKTKAKEQAAKDDEEDDPIAVESISDDPSDSPKDGSDDSSGGLLALLFLIPAAIIGFGVWRMQQARKRGANGAAGPDSDVPGD